MDFISIYLVDMYQLALSGDDQAIFFWIAAYAWLMCTISVIWQIRVSRWPFVAGRLLRHGLEKVGREAVRVEQAYQASAVYEYEVDGQSYTGSRVSYLVMTGSGGFKNVGETQLKGIQRLPDGSVKVFYNPRRPKKSMLVIPGVTSITVTFVLSLVMPFFYFLKFYT